MSSVTTLSSYVHSQVESLSARLGVGFDSGMIAGIASQAISDKTLLLFNAYDSSISFPPGYDIVDITRKEMVINYALFCLLGEDHFSRGIKTGVTLTVFNQVVFIVAARMIEYRIRDLRLPRSKNVNSAIHLISFLSVSAACYGGFYLGGLLGIIFAANICMLLASMKAPRGGIFITSPFTA